MPFIMTINKSWKGHSRVTVTNRVTSYSTLKEVRKIELPAEAQFLP